MDPLASVKEYREQSEGRKIRLAPPPVIPTPPPVEPQADVTTVEFLDIPHGESAETPIDQAHLPGMPRGRKRLLQVNLPGPSRRLLEQARDAHESLGAAAAAALRGSYHHIVEHHTPEPVEPVGPFPAPRAIRRREHVDDARTNRSTSTPAKPPPSSSSPTSARCPFPSWSPSPSIGGTGRAGPRLTPRKPEVSVGSPKPRRPLPGLRKRQRGDRPSTHVPFDAADSGGNDTSVMRASWNTVSPSFSLR
jgi:hypothetical protein